MSTVRVLVRTRKGACVLTADATRARWEVSGPHFGGWDIYHLRVALQSRIPTPRTYDERAPESCAWIKGTSSRKLPI